MFRSLLIAALFLVVSPVVVAIAFAQTEETGALLKPVPPIDRSDIALGKPGAPITVIEYASMTCPHCADFMSETFPKVKSEWVDTGKVRYVFRDFPLDGLALAASVIAHCLPRDEFYPFVEVLYANQRNWVTADDPQAAVERYAKLAGMSDDRFKACIADEDAKKAVVKSRQLAEAAGVNSTPSFFINGIKIAGALPYTTFAKDLADAMPHR